MFPKITNIIILLIFALHTQAFIRNPHTKFISFLRASHDALVNNKANIEGLVTDHIMEHIQSDFENKHPRQHSVCNGESLLRLVSIWIQKVGNNDIVTQIEKIQDTDAFIEFLIKEISLRQGKLIEFYGINGDKKFLDEVYSNPLDFGLTCDAYKVYEAYSQQI